MSKALIFPGQGAQTIGMGQALAEAYPAARAVFDEVDEALGEKLSELIWEGEADVLTLTQNAQPALMATSIAALRALEAEGFKVGDAAFVAGHSLGEYSALAAAGSLSVADAARLLRTRGRAMQEAVPVGLGAMAALLGLDLATAREVAAEAAGDQVCEAANDNDPAQVVVSGHKAAVERAVEIAKAQGAMTIAVVTYPFKSEGSLRKQNAEWGLERLREHCDTILVIPNERLLEIEGVKDLPIASAFRVGDELLVRSITGVTELLTTDGMVNLDFEDLKSIVQSGAGVAMIGLGSARGPGRADAATMEALHSPLLDLDMSDARGALINVVGGASLTLGEAERCSQLIKEQISPNAKIIWGAAVKEELGDELRVMLVLTGVKSDQIHGSTENRQLRALRNRQIEFVN